MRRRSLEEKTVLPTLLLCASILAAEPEDRKNYFTITVVDEQTGRGVPLVELHRQRHPPLDRQQRHRRLP
jgi:hypothetical protein